MNYSFRQLKAFLLVSELGNFTRAAERLHITQAGLSVMMRELEGQFGSRLFDRTTRSVSLTAAGETLLPAAHAAVDQLEQAAAAIGDIGQRARQTLRVAATPLVSSSLLPAVFGAFRHKYPDLNLQLQDADLARVHALVDAGEADFGLGFFFKAARGIERTLLCSFSLMRVAPLRGSKARGQQPVGKVAWSALQNDPLIGLPRDNPIQQFVDSHLAKIGRANEDRASFRHFDTLIGMVAAGMGTTVIPSFALLACHHHRVATDILVEPEESLGFYRISKRGRAKPPLMAEFSETLVSLLPR
ncbi:MAG: LysR family transcriptional regulator [Massilia sp.]